MAAQRGARALDGQGQLRRRRSEPGRSEAQTGRERADGRALVRRRSPRRQRQGDRVDRHILRLAAWSRFALAHGCALRRTDRAAWPFRAACRRRDQAVWRAAGPRRIAGPARSRAGQAGAGEFRPRGPGEPGETGDRRQARRGAADHGGERDRRSRRARRGQSEDRRIARSRRRQGARRACRARPRGGDRSAACHDLARRKRPARWRCRIRAAPYGKRARGVRRGHGSARQGRTARRRQSGADRYGRATPPERGCAGGPAARIREPARICRPGAHLSRTSRAGSWAQESGAASAFGSLRRS